MAITMKIENPVFRVLARTDLYPVVARVPFAACFSFPCRSSLVSISALVPPGLEPKSPVAVQRKLCFEDCFEDAKRLAASIAAQYTDKSCVFLHTDELEAEARFVLVNVLEKKWLNRAANRAEFFRVLKSAMMNRMRSLLQQHRYTQKRTGIKPPPKHERNIRFESCKPKEISLDDPEAHLQVGEEEQGLHEDGLDTKELIREIKARLNYIEKGVFEELTSPSIDALNLAWIESHRKQEGVPPRLDITDAQKAEALGVTEEQFRKAVLRIQQVTLRLREMNPDDQSYEMAVEKLAELFHLQIPKSTNQMIVRRMLTIAARDNWQKVNPEAEQLLGIVGAESPKFDRDALRCYGVLYLRGHRLCESCGMKPGCSARAENAGLGLITIHPKLLGAKMRRTPYITPVPARDKPLLTSSMRDSDIVTYLSTRKFKRVTHQGDLYFQPKDFPDKQKMLFCIGQTSIPLRLRFCNPNQPLRKKLLYANKGYYPSEQLSAAEVIVLIDEHVKSAYA